MNTRVQTQVLRKSGNWTYAALVDILPRNVPAPAELIYRYYGLEAPEAAFLSQIVARLIFKLAEESYYVVPDSPSGYTYWRFTNEVKAD